MIVSALALHRPGLAFGNLIGSCISNLLGAFSLGLLFHRDAIATFDRSARIYAAVLLGVTTLVTGTLLGLFCFFVVDDGASDGGNDDGGRGGNGVAKVAGGTLIIGFGIYVGSVLWAIWRGVVDAPEDSDSDSDGDNDSDSDNSSEGEDCDSDGENDSDREAAAAAAATRPQTVLSGSGPPSLPPNEASALLGPRPAHRRPLGVKKGRKALLHHALQLLLGFLLLSLSGYLLSHSASSLSTELGLADSLAGLTILSFVTTLPEKIVALLSGARGHAGILVASTAGSNIFLLTLCLGITLLAGNDIGSGSTDEDGNRQVFDITINELAVLWFSTLVFAAVIWFGARRAVGALMLAAYVTFLVAEFTIWRR